MRARDRLSVDERVSAPCQGWQPPATLSRGRTGAWNTASPATGGRQPPCQPHGWRRFCPSTMSPLPRSRCSTGNGSAASWWSISTFTRRRHRRHLMARSGSRPFPCMPRKTIRCARSRPARCRLDDQTEVEAYLAAVEEGCSVRCLWRPDLSSFSTNCWVDRHSKRPAGASGA